MTATRQDTGGEARQRRGAQRRGVLARLVRWLALGIGALLAAALLAMAVVVALAVPLDLGFLRATIEAAATDTLGRRVAIDGPIALVPGLAATVRLERARVEGPGDGAPDLLRLDYGKARIALVPLLAGRIEIERLALVGVAVDLIRTPDGRANWQLERAAPARRHGEAAPRLPDLGELAVRDLTITYEDRTTGERRRAELRELAGSARAGAPVRLRARGALRAVPYVLVAEGGPLADLLAPRGPWPLALALDLAGASLEVAGTVPAPLRAGGAELAFSLTGAATPELERLADVPLPPLGAYQLHGRISARDDLVRFAGLRGATETMAFTGALDLNLGAERPRVSGGLDVTSLDVAPMIAAIRRASDAKVQADGAVEAEGEQQLDLDQPVWSPTVLRSFDGALDLRVREMTGLGGEVRDASLALTVQDGALAAPVALSFAEVPFSGWLELAAEGEGLGLEVALDAGAGAIGDLARLVYGAADVEGRFEHADLSVTARGATVRSLIETLEFWFGLQGARLSYGAGGVGGERLALTLEEAGLLIPPRKRLQIVADGALLGEPFHLDAVGGDMAQLLSEDPWPIAVSVTAADADLRLEGTMGGADPSAAAELDLEVSGQNVGGLARWLPVAAEAAVPFALGATVVATDQAWRVPRLDGRLGNTVLTGELSSPAASGEAIYGMRLAIETLDVEQLSTILASAGPGSDDHAYTIDVPILPRGVSLEDGDVEVSINRALMRPAAVTDLSLSGRIRDGRVQSSPFAATLGGARFAGSLALDLRERVPEAELQIAAGPIDVGTFLAELGVARGLELGARGLAVELTLAGASLREMLAGATLAGELNDGHWTLRDPGNRHQVTVQVPSGRLRAAPGQPTTLGLDGLIAETPIRFDLRTDGLVSLADPEQEASLRIEAEGAGGRLELSGRSRPPFRLDEFQGALALRGARLDELAALAEVALPPLGPYALEGEFGTGPSGYYVDALELRVGASTLSGNLDLITTDARPRVHLDLTSEVVQLADLGIGDWSPLEGGAASPGGNGETAGAERPTAEAGAIQALLSPGVMSSFDADLDLAVASVLSGTDALGAVTLALSLKDGRLAISPLRLAGPAGRVDAALAYQPTPTEVRAEARAQVDDLDYGVLARMIDPLSDVDGTISLDVAVTARAPDPDRLMAHADGHVGFVIWPADLDEEVFHLWAANLLLEVLPKLDSQAQARFNCIVGWFEAQDGRMKSEKLFVDSTRMQVFGEGAIDLENQTVDIVLAPRAKQARLFSVATPIHVTGPLTDVDLGIGASDAVLTAIRLYYTVLVYVFESVFGEGIPADGRVACQEAWAWQPVQPE